MKSILKIDNLSYKDILKKINLSLSEKSFNVLVGPNGSGKTTLIKCIAGLIKYEGNITLYNNKNYINDIGVFMDDNFLLDGTSLYNITYPLLNLKYDEKSAKKKAYDISKKLDIDSLLMKNINELSLSERKIISFTSTIVCEPKLIIIDDSFQELDSYNRKKIINYLKRQNKSTILFITNNEEDILLADNLIIMNDGKIIECMGLKEILNDEKIFIKNDIKLPFLVDLSHKLKSYELIDDIILNKNEMVDTIWK